MLKTLFFVGGYIFSIVISLLALWGTDDSTGLFRRVFQMTAVEALGLLIICLVYRYVYRRIFSKAEEYQFRFPGRRVTAGIFLIMPFATMVQVGAVIWGRAPEYLWQIDRDFTWNGILEMFLELPLVALLGPVFEEFCYRILPLSSWKTRAGRIVAGTVTVCLFSWMHASSWKMVLPMAVLLSAVYLWTKNPVITILIHMANNLSTILIPGFSGIYVLLNTKAELGLLGFPLPVIMFCISCFAAGVFLFVKEYDGRFKSKQVRKKT